MSSRGSNLKDVHVVDLIQFQCAWQCGVEYKRSVQETLQSEIATCNLHLLQKRR